MKEATVDSVQERGFELGPHRAVAHDCGHRWGDHILHADFEDDPMKGGMFSCPSCDCGGTWSVGQRVCAVGREILPPEHTEPCASPPTHRVLIANGNLDDGMKVWLCDEHLRLIEGALDD